MRNGVVVVLLFVAILVGAGAGYFMGSSGLRLTTSVSTTTLFHTYYASAGHSACGSYTSAAVGSPQIALSYEYTGSSVCLDFNFTNTSGETVYPTAGIITVVNSTGTTLFNQTLVSAGASQFGLAPGKSWTGTTYWSPSSPVAAGDRMSVSVRFVSEQNVTATVTTTTYIS